MLPVLFPGSRIVLASVWEEKDENVFQKAKDCNHTHYDERSELCSPHFAFLTGKDKNLTHILRPPPQPIHPLCNQVDVVTPTLGRKQASTGTKYSLTKNWKRKAGVKSTKTPETKEEKPNSYPSNEQKPTTTNAKT